MKIKGKTGCKVRGNPGIYPLKSGRLRGKIKGIISVKTGQKARGAGRFMPFSTHG